MSGLWFPQRGTEVPDAPAARLREGVFQPQPLPADLKLRSRTYREMARAQEWLGRADEAIDRLPGPNAVIRATQIREVQSSAGLDNVYATLQEVLLAELPGAQSATPIAPVLSRYLGTCDMAIEAVAAGADLDVALWSRISRSFRDHAVKTGGCSSGEDVWRDQPGWLGSSVHEAYLLTGPDRADTKPAVAQLATWIAAECLLPLVGKLALTHYQLTVLNPFRWGNGHLARLHVGLELIRAGVTRGQILPVSMWLDRNRDEYHRQIRQVVDSGGFDEWIEFFATGVREAAMNQVRLVKDLEAAYDRLLAQLAGGSDPRQAGNLGTGNTRLVLRGMLADPITNHAQIAKRHGLTTRSAMDITRRLCDDAKVIENMGNRTRNKVFIVPEFMNLLSLNDPPPPAHDRDAFHADGTAGTRS
jgi:Fic/DOC family N-terminal